MTTMRKNQSRDGPPSTGQEVLDTEQPPGVPTDPELIYRSKLRRVLVSFNYQHTLASPVPPSDLITRAEQRMVAAQEAGEVESFTIHKELFEKTWIALHQSASPPTFNLNLVLASGKGKLPGLEVVATKEPDCLARISIHTPMQVVADWRFEWFFDYVHQALISANVMERANMVQLHGIFLRAMAGQPVKNAPLSPLNIPNQRDDQAFCLSLNKMRREVSITIFDLKAAQDLSQIAARLGKVEQSLKNIHGSDRARFRLLKSELIKSITLALRGPQAVGIDLPLICLAAIDMTPVVDPNAPRKPSRNDNSGCTPAYQPSNGSRYVSLDISDDRMIAKLSSIDLKQLNAQELNKDRLIRELKQAGIRYGIHSRSLSEALTKLQAGDDVSGIVIAEGQSPVPAAQPYLHLIREERDEDKASETNQSVDMRSYQRQHLVKAGQVIAEVRYDVPARDGVDVLGRRLRAPSSSENLEVKLSEGIERGNDQKFTALCDGVLEMDEDNQLTLKKILVHEGDVNMTSGNIRFDGPVEIKGNIETGVRIETGGDLSILGEVRGGKIICSGNVDVKGGIVTGSAGSLHARGDVIADFIENSTIICGGNIRVKKSVLHCRLMAGAEIIVELPSGLLGGGSVACGKRLTSANVGLPEGAKTEIHAGVDYRGERAIMTRSQRLANLQKTKDSDKQALRELVRRKSLSKSHQENKLILQRRLSRWATIIEKAEQSLRAAADKQAYNNTATIVVKNKLSSNCSIKIAGKTIPLRKEYVSVTISGMAKDGSHMSPST